jgi:hypothetical protein
LPLPSTRRAPTDKPFTFPANIRCPIPHFMEKQFAGATADE